MLKRMDGLNFEATREDAKYLAERVAAGGDRLTEQDSRFCNSF